MNMEEFNSLRCGDRVMVTDPFNIYDSLIFEVVSFYGTTGQLEYVIVQLKSDAIIELGIDNSNKTSFKKLGNKTVSLKGI